VIQTSSPVTPRPTSAQQQTEPGDGTTLHPFHRRVEAQQDRGRQEDQHGGDRRRHGQPLVERPHDVVAGTQLDEEGAGNRADDADGADHQRIDHQARLGVTHKENRRQQHGGDDRDRVGLEKVGGHAGAVADIVADIIGNDRGVPGIVLRDASFDLAHEVGADIGPLGEDAAA